MQCKHCQVNISKKTAKIFCSRSCSAKYNNLRRTPRDQESRNKTTESLKEHFKSNNFIKKNIKLGKDNTSYKHGKYIPELKLCIICKKEFKSIYKTCSKECYCKLRSKQMTERLMNRENRKNYGRGKKSYLEKTFEEWLKYHKIFNYESEIHFHNNIINKNYFVDFLFEDKKNNC